MTVAAPGSLQEEAAVAASLQEGTAAAGWLQETAIMGAGAGGGLHGGDERRAVARGGR